MSQSKLNQRNTEEITNEELFKALHNWPNIVRATGRHPHIDNFLGRNIEDAIDRTIWRVPPHIANKIHLLASPHCVALYKARHIKKHPRKFSK